MALGLVFSKALRQGIPSCPIYLWLLWRLLVAFLRELWLKVIFQVRGKGGARVQILHLLFTDDTCVLRGFTVSDDLFKLVAYLVQGHIRVENQSEWKWVDFNGEDGKLRRFGLGVWFVRWVYSLPLTWVFLWVPCLNLWRLQIGWKRGFVKGWPWKRYNISQKEGNTLIWSTLSSMPIFYMSLFSMPRSIILRLKQIQKDFLWGRGLSFESRT